MPQCWLCAFTYFCSMSALPTPDKKLLALRKRLFDEGLGVYFDGLWQVEVRVERSKRLGSECQRREVLAHCVWYWTCYRYVPTLKAFMVRVQTYLHHPTYGQARSLPGAVKAVKRRHSCGASAVNASLAPTLATTNQDNAKPEYQYAGFDCAKAFLKVLAYILCALFIMFSSLVIFNMVTMQWALA